MNRKKLGIAAGVGVAALVLGGCATHSYVGKELARSEQTIGAKVGEVQSQVETAQGDISALKQSDATQNERIAGLSDTTRDALARAQEAHKLAEGKLLYEVTLSDDAVHFSLASAELTKEGRAALDALAERLKSENKGVYIEIQGHTDATGPKDFNMKLGEERADAVRRYLNIQHGIPLHRMNVVSYGDEKPVADNKTREGRATNRRVTLVVLA